MLTDTRHESNPLSGGQVLNRVGLTNVHDDHSSAALRPADLRPCLDPAGLARLAMR
jgi:hypothetical protein